MKKVVLLTTGGTIASKYNEETGLYTAGAFTGEELKEMCALPEHISVEVESVFQIPSNQMSFDKLLVLKNKIENVFKDEKVDGIVVTSGTDTLEETAYFLDLTINSERPVVVTGAQRGPTQLGTDAMENIRQAVVVAANEQVKGFGSVVVFNEKIMSAKYVKKVQAVNLDGFHARGYGYFGIVDGEDVHLYQKPLAREYYNIKQELKEVDIIPFYLGTDDRFIQASINVGASGIVIEGSGRGHITPKAAEGVAVATTKGVITVLTTRADEGLTKQHYDFAGGVYDLVEKGILLARDYDSKKARIKLAVLLTMDYDKEQIRQAFLK